MVSREEGKERKRKEGREGEIGKEGKWKGGNGEGVRKERRKEWFLFDFTL